MKRFCYVQTNPLPVNLLVNIQNKASENGWEYVDALVVGLAVNQQAIIPAGGQPQGIPAVIAHFRREIPVNATEMPTFPTISLGTDAPVPGKNGPTGVIDGKE